MAYHGLAAGGVWLNISGNNGVAYGWRGSHPSSCGSININMALAIM